MKKLTLTLYIDPAAAVRAGRTEMGEVQRTLTDAELAQLTPEQRDALARHVAGDGEYYTYGTHTAKGPTWCDALTRHADPIADVTIETIAKLLDQRIEVVEFSKKKLEAAQIEKRRQADEEIALAIANYGKDTDTLAFDDEGKVSTYGTLYSIRIPELSYCDTAYASPEAQAAYQAAKEREQADREQARLAAMPEVTRRLEEARAQAEARKREYEALYARLPEALRERDAAGYASKDEVTRHLRCLLRSDAGLPTKESWKKSERVEQLTDAQFARLKEVKATAPEGAEVEVRLVNDGEGYYREAGYDERDEADNDGEIWVEPKNERVLALITWQRASVQVCSTARL